MKKLTERQENLLRSLWKFAKSHTDPAITDISLYADEGRTAFALEKKGLVTVDVKTPGSRIARLTGLGIAYALGLTDGS